VVAESLKKYASPIAFTSTGGYSQSVAYGSEVLRSADGGHTWTSIDSGIGGKGRSICVTPADTRVVFVTTDAGVFRTRDAGTTWQLVWSAAERGGGAGIVVDSVNASLVYAQGPGGLWISEDGGDHWQMAPLPNPAAFGLLPDPVDSGRLFVATQAGAVFESRDKGATWNQLSPDVPDIGGTFDYVTHPAIVANGAQRAIAAVAKSTVLRLDLPTAALGVGTALWLNPDQLGWGLSLAQHDNGQVFAVWFTYDAAGKPRWYFVPGGEWSRGTIFAGTLYEAHAAPRDFFTTSFDASSVIKTRVGQMRLEFANSESGTAAFSLDDGTTVVQPIRRALFGKPVGGQPNMGDLWFNPAESGWGITLHQQYNTVFATWFVYDTDGSPTWLVMPDAAHNYGVITGDVYRPAAASTGMPFVASGVSTHKVGTARTSGMLDTELSATIDGKSWARPITRIPF